jgi:tryptophan-rich sensory protein
MNSSYNWYQALIKPSWAPPGWLFRPVWTVLYVIIAITFGTVFYKAFTGKIPWLVALPFALNLIFNFAFTPIQFKLKNNFLASIDILLVLGTLIWALFAIYSFGLKLHIETGAPTYSWIIYANIPYLLWVSFATILQLTITFLNR